MRTDRSALRKIDIGTSRLEEMARFYREVFKFELAAGESQGCRTFNFRLEGLEISLAEDPEMKPGMGNHQFHVEVPDPNAILNRAKSAGYNTQEAGEEALTRAYVWDPDGNPWGLRLLGS
ncbi:MAG: hypothetical protein AMXMBFR7_25970 [Planctomycetota bacterium]